jgi:hypothetical protein
VNTGAWVWLVLGAGWVVTGRWQEKAKAEGWPPGTGLYAVAPLLLLLAWLLGFVWAWW